MANKRKPAKAKPVQEAPPPPPEPTQPIADYISSFQDKNFTQNDIDHLMRLYESTEPAEFVEQFLAVFQVAICGDPKQTKRTDNVLAFYLAFIVAFESDETPYLWEEFFNWILNHKHLQTHVRVRMCQFIENFLGAMNMNAVLDVNICEGIEKYLILNADDFSNLVRGAALNGLARLQDPTNPTGPIWRHYLFHLHDPAANVRKAVITSICKNRFSIPRLLEHLLDKDTSVRSHLVQSLANVSYKHFKTEDRLKLVEDGLLQGNQSASVRNGIKETILVSWFAEMDRNYLKFTKSLLLETSWKEFRRSLSSAKAALKHLFSVDPGYLQYLENLLTKPEHEIMDSICDSVERSLVLDGSQCGNLSQLSGVASGTQSFEHCIDMARLTPDVAIYWSAVLEFYQEAHEDDGIFPELSTYLSFLTAYDRRSGHSVTTAAGDLKQKRRFQYIFGILVDNLHLYEFKDQCVRQFLKDTSHRIILSTNIKKDTLRTLLRIHSEIYPEDDEYLDSIVRAIHEELAEFGGLTVASVNDTQNNTSLGNTSTGGRNGLAEEVRIKHYLKVVHLLLINRGRIRKLTPLLKDLYANVIIPRVENGDRKIRIWSIKCTTTFALLDVSVAQEFYYKLITHLQVQHNVHVWAVTIESIFDLLARYGIEFLGGGGSTASNDPNKKSSDATTATKGRSTGRALYNTTSECWGAHLDDSIEQVNILEVLQTLFNDSPELLIVKPIVIGFCRLILTGQCQSVELMMKLMIAFFTTDTFPELVQILGAFFAELCDREMQDLLVVSLLPTLEYVAANPNLPLEMESVVQFVVDSTAEKASGTTEYHQKLAHLFVETIQANEKQKALNKIMFKYLSLLDIPCDAFDNTELERMCTSLAKCEHVKPDQLETVRRKLSGVRRDGSTIHGEGTTIMAESSTIRTVVMEAIEEKEDDAEDQEEEDQQIFKAPFPVEEQRRNEEEEENSVESEATITKTVTEERPTEASEIEDVEMMSEVEDEDKRNTSVLPEDNTTIPGTPDESTTMHTNAAICESLGQQKLQMSEDEEESTMVTPPTPKPVPEETQSSPNDAEDQGQETDNSVSSAKENRESPIRARARRGATAIPRRVNDVPLDGEKVQERRQRTRTGSKIPVMNVQTRNKRSLDKSTTMMTPDVKQKRGDMDPNVRRKHLMVRSAERAPRTPPAKNGTPNTATKSTSTPLSETIGMSRVVLSPLDMSKINMTQGRPKTRSATVLSQRSLRTRNTNRE